MDNNDNYLRVIVGALIKSLDLTKGELVRIVREHSDKDISKEIAEIISKIPDDNLEGSKKDFVDLSNDDESFKIGDIWYSGIPD